MGLEKEDEPNPQLKRIIKVPLKAGETKQIEISLPKESFMLYDEGGRHTLYQGTYHIKKHRVSAGRIIDAGRLIPVFFQSSKAKRSSSSLRLRYRLWAESKGLFQ